MNASSNDIIEGQNANVIVNLPSDTKGDVKITVNNREYTGTINNGIVRFEISDLTMGSYDVAISYDGDNKYAPISNTTKINVEPRKNISINVNDTILRRGISRSARSASQVPHQFPGISIFCCLLTLQAKQC